MTAITLGAGPRAVRILFGEGRVQVRTYGSVIDGNADMARALDLVLNEQPAEIETHPDLNDEAVETICQLLRDLVRYGVPVELWGSAWAQQCATGSAV